MWPTSRVRGCGTAPASSVARRDRRRGRLDGPVLADGDPPRSDTRRPPPVASGMAALMSPDLRERRPGQWRWRESNLTGSVGTGWNEALTWGNVRALAVS